MSNNSTIKYWTSGEEIQLIDEINNLTNIDEILQNHNRKIAGILARIEKILNDPIKSSKIFDKDKIIEKYLSNAKNNLFYNYEELYSNILNFNSLDEISDKYNKLSHLKIKNILNNFLEKKDLDLAKKLRIKCLLKSSDDLDFAEKVLDKKNIKTDTISSTEQIKLVETINPNNILDNINSIMITLLNEIKTMKTDIFDIRNRVKIIMDKVNKIENNYNSKNDLNNNQIITSSKKNIKLEIFDIEELSRKKPIITVGENVNENNDNCSNPDNGNINNDNNNNDGLDDEPDDDNKIDNDNNDEIIKTINKKDKKDKKKKEKRNKHHHNDIDINKHVEKIILSTNDKIMKKNNLDTYDNISNYDSDELEKELTKIINN